MPQPAGSARPRPGGGAGKPTRPATGARPARPTVRSTTRRGPATVYRVEPSKRLSAASADLIIGALPAGAVLVQTSIWISAIIVVLYLLVRDGLPIAALDYASPGKKILGLHVEVEATGDTRLDLLQSVRRNLPLVPGLALLPLLWGVSSVLALVVAAIPPLVELVMLLTDPNGLRLGDRLAGTKVLD